MFSQDRAQLRQAFFTTWQKMKAKQAMIPLEQSIAHVIAQHPEYHAVLDNEKNLDRDYSPQAGQPNPFLHMALHISIHEQLATDRPPGVARLFADFRHRQPDPHQVEHLFMECLGDTLWRAQREQRAPDEEEYRSCLQQKARNPVSAP